MYKKLANGMQIMQDQKREQGQAQKGKARRRTTAAKRKPTTTAEQKYLVKREDDNDTIFSISRVLNRSGRSDVAIVKYKPRNYTRRNLYYWGKDGNVIGTCISRKRKKVETPKLAMHNASSQDQNMQR